MEKNTDILEDYDRIPYIFRDFLYNFIQTLKKEYGKNLLSVVLYGSIARGTWNLSSDLDLFMIFSNETKEKKSLSKDVLKIIMEFEKFNTMNTGKNLNSFLPIQDISLKLKDLENFRTLFYDIAMDGILIYDTNSIGATFLEKIRNRIEEKGLQRIFIGYDNFYWKRKENVKFGEIFEL
ncbi:MAG: nucleotidyltransferase domain-containing protein [Promethearchaeota archaeon]